VFAQHQHIGAIRISLASPEQIRSWSSGEVLRPDTINHRTQRPEKGGLFCERIFGPVKDWACACGKFTRLRAKGIVCDRCGVEVGPSTLRRERMGHIELAAPVAHPWYSRSAPSSMALLLGLTSRELREILSYSLYVVTSRDEQARELALQRLAPPARGRDDLLRLNVMGTLSEARYHELREAWGPGVFCAGTGAATVRDLLEGLDLDALAEQLRRESRTHAGDRRARTVRRLGLVEALRASGVQPAWMILTVLPVLPPELRPVVSLAGGRLASADLNELYQRVLVRNERVRRLQQAEAPQLILHHEQRLLQAAVDALFDNRGASTGTTSSPGSRHPLRSLSDVLSGKGGRFRRNLLGKRVDYSARSVIVVGPDLRLHQCGLPKSLALELFKPFVMRRLVERGCAFNTKSAARLVQRQEPEVWDALEEVIRDHPVLLNRAPTLHRLSLQAFEPVLVEGSAIQLHPLVCSAYNADFDGDQMAVHLPLSPRAREEARSLLLSTVNLLSPATGEPSIGASGDMVLGCYYLTEVRPGQRGEGRRFSDAVEARLAYEHGVVGLQAQVGVRLPGVSALFDAPPPAPPRPLSRGELVETTVGRLIFNEALPARLGYRNYATRKEHLKQILGECFAACGREKTAALADAIKGLGFSYATRSGVTLAMGDLTVPSARQEELARADARIAELDDQYREGLITGQEKYQQTLEVWNEATENVTSLVEAALDPFGPLATIAQSGATKAKFQQIRQLSGMRGLMASPSGRIIDVPIRGNFSEGLSVLEYFISSHGARKGLADTALRTAESGYLTRRLVDAAQEVVVTQEDCGDGEGILVTNEESRALGLPSLAPRLIGRVLAEGSAHLPAGTLLTDERCAELVAAGVDAARVRSPLTCQAPRGVCRRCYGADLATGQLVAAGAAVGVIAAQSIGEPGTQLTLRTFHSGGTAFAQGDITQGLPRIIELFEARAPREPAVLSEIDGEVFLAPAEPPGAWAVRVLGAAHPSLDEREERLYQIPPARALAVRQGQWIVAGTPLTTGSYNPQDILRICGRGAAQMYLLREMQAVYRATGVYLHDKHIEIVIRQMLRRVLIEDPGDTTLIPGQIVEARAFADATAAALAEGGAPATARLLLLGITRAALETDSFLAAASFQHTKRVLAQAALAGQPDRLVGLKENVIIGGRIPAGSGLRVGAGAGEGQSRSGKERVTGVAAQAVLAYALA
jgi:DNA-directed RNA polymerase subunit beta'